VETFDGLKTFGVSTGSFYKRKNRFSLVCTCLF